MSLEVKSVDIENDQEADVISVFQSFGWKLKSSQRVFNQSSRPTGAISYEGLTYVHSETDIVDFTKLVFERDTNMPYYDEIVDLEEEFWELSSELPNARPPEPELMDLKEWIKQKKPFVIPKSKKILLSIPFYLILPLFITILVGVSSLGDFHFWIVGLVFLICLLLVPPNIMISMLLLSICNSRILKKDLDNIDPIYYKELQNKYAEYVQDTKALQADAISYDNTVNTMRGLIRKSEKLL